MVPAVSSSSSVIVIVVDHGGIIIANAEEDDPPPPGAPMLNSHTPCLGNWQTWLPPSNMAAPIVLTATPGGGYWN